MEVALQAHAQGVILPVRAHAAARRNGVAGVQDGMLKVSVTTAPEKGKANKAIQELLAKTLGVKKGQVELLAGETSPAKKFLLRGVSVAGLSAMIEAILDG